MNTEVSNFIDQLNHPLRSEIEMLRKLILATDKNMSENIKWNSPNYCYLDADRITMKIQPPKKIQLIFHRGAKKIAQPKNKLIAYEAGLLIWKENDRAIATFSNAEEIEKNSSAIQQLVKDWISATEE